MERLLNGAGWRREEQRYQPATSSQRAARTPALSRGGANAASAPRTGHSSRHFPPEMPLSTTNEKELLRGLNERFVGFIEKVRRLESQNRALEEEIEDIRLKAKSATSLAEQYEPELQDLRRQVREVAMQKHQLELEQKRVQDECSALIDKCVEEARSRGEAEESIAALKKYVDSAHLTKQDMDRKANALADEIGFLKRNHEAEVTDILTQIKETRVSAQVRGFGKGELTAALRDIRTQLEGRALCPDTYSEQRFSQQLVQLTKAAEKDREALIATKAEISQHKRQLQTRTAELDSFRGMRGALEKQLYDLEQRHSAEIHQYQDTIRELDQELKNTKYDMSSHVQEYHDLLNVKMALDAEIYSYRKLLEGEESRYSTASDAQIPGRYVYRQSPIYTLPCVPGMGGVTRKAEPQYKFVEEIITETTSEDIEISDTGSDDGEEQGESDKVCSEKENEGTAEESEEHLEGKMIQDSDAEDHRDSQNAEQLDNEEKPTENEEQSIKKFPDVSTYLEEGSKNTELAEDNTTAAEQARKQDPDIGYNNVDNIGSKTKETDLDPKTEKIQEAKGDAEEGENIAKEIDQDGIKEPKPAEQTATHEAVLPEAGKESAKEKIPPDSENKEATQHVAEHEGSSTKKTTEKDGVVKPAEVDTSSADPQPVPQKAEAGQEPNAKSEADSMQSVETAQADVLNTKKAASAQDNAVEEQKTLEEKVKTEAPLNSEVKEIQPKEEKKIDSKPETHKISVKPEKEDRVQSTEDQKPQEIVPKPAMKDSEIEISEKKESQSKALTDSAKTEGNVELKKTEEEDDRKQVIEQPTVSAMETKSEAQKKAMKDTEDINTEKNLKTVENLTTKSSGTQKDDIPTDKEPKSVEKEIKDEQVQEKQVSKINETSMDIKKTESIKPEGQETDSNTSKDVAPEQSLTKTSSEKEQGENQTDKHEIKDPKTENPDTKQDNTKMETAKMKELEKDPTPPKDSKIPEPPEKVSPEKAPDDSTKAGLKRERDVTENGVNI